MLSSLPVFCLITEPNSSTDEDIDVSGPDPAPTFIEEVMDEGGGDLDPTSLHDNNVQPPSGPLPSGTSTHVFTTSRLGCFERQWSRRHNSSLLCGFNF